MPTQFLCLFLFISQIIRAAPPPAFRLVFTCTTADARECAQVNATIRSSLDLISRELTLRAPISVQATWTPLCEDQAECRRLGSARPARFVDVDGVDVPVALWKQRGGGGGGADIIANFNSAYPRFHLHDGLRDADVRKQADMLSLRYVVIHEMVHGLGFISTLPGRVSLFDSLIEGDDPRDARDGGGNYSIAGVGLYAPLVYRRGSSLSHLDGARGGEVMRPTLGDFGRTVGDKLPRIFGPDTRKVLRAMGWTFQEDEDNNNEI